MEIDKYTTYIIEVKDPHSLEFDPGYFFRIKEKEFPLLSGIMKKTFYFFQPHQDLLKVYLV